jgi:hypothetical protein
LSVGMKHATYVFVVVHALISNNPLMYIIHILPMYVHTYVFCAIKMGPCGGYISPRRHFLLWKEKASIFIMVLILTTYVHKCPFTYFICRSVQYESLTVLK